MNLVDAAVLKSTVLIDGMDAVPIIVRLGQILHLLAEFIEAFCPGKVEAAFLRGRGKLGQFGIDHDAAGIGA